jgi:hypothetical protein
VVEALIASRNAPRADQIDSFALGVGEEDVERPASRAGVGHLVVGQLDLLLAGPSKVSRR